MTRLIRILGFMLIAAGVVTVATWLIKPLRFIWPWLRQLPIAIQIGFAVAAVGFLLLFGAIIWERLEDHEREKDMIDEP
jgi:uncharacterized membrane protein